MLELLLDSPLMLLLVLSTIVVHLVAGVLVHRAIRRAARNDADAGPPQA